MNKIQPNFCFLKLYHILIISFFCDFQVLLGADEGPTCFGTKSAKFGLVYLHGIDERAIGSLETANRAILKKLSEQFQVRIAIPRGNQTCGNKLCWDHSGVESVNKSMAGIKSETASCLENRPLIGLIGFSNGGYLVNKYFQMCLDSPKVSFLVIGALGNLKKEPASLKSCGHLTLSIGRRDMIRDQVKSLYRELKKNFPDKVTLEIYEGGHELSYQALHGWLNQVLKLDQEKSFIK